MVAFCDLTNVVSPSFSELEVLDQEDIKSRERRGDVIRANAGVQIASCCSYRENVRSFLVDSAASQSCELGFIGLRSSDLVFSLSCYRNRHSQIVQIEGRSQEECLTDGKSGDFVGSKYLTGDLPQGVHVAQRMISVFR